MKKEIADKKYLSDHYYFHKYGLDGLDNPEKVFEQFILLDPPEKEKPHGSNYDFSFSNLGSIALEPNYGEYQIQEVYGPTYSAYGVEQIFGLNTFDGKMFFTFISDKTSLEQNVFHKIKKTIFDLLDKELA